MLIALLIPLGLATLGLIFLLARAAIARRATPTFEAVVLGAVTNFFDTLGIGSFAPTTAWFKFRKMVPDRLIPPTVLVGQGLPTMTEAIIFLVLLGVAVDPVLLVGCMMAVFLGGVLGALTWYVCYVMLAALWNNQDFWALALDPSAIPALSSRRRSGVATSAPVLMYVGIGLLAGAWVTDYAIKKKWTS